MTARDLIRQALLQLGAVASTAPMREGEADDGLVALQGFVDTLQTQRLTISTVARALYPIVAGTASYTLGPTQVAPQWTGARPTWVEAAAVVDTDGIEYALELLTDADYQAIADKSLTGWPSALYVDRAYPNPVCTLYPGPTDARLVSVALYTPVPLTAPATLDTVLLLPPAAYEALLYGLAVRCAAPYGKPLDPTVATLASDTLGAWKRSNERPTILDVDLALRSGAGACFDWRVG